MYRSLKLHREKRVVHHPGVILKKTNMEQTEREAWLGTSHKGASSCAGVGRGSSFKQYGVAYAPFELPPQCPGPHHPKHISKELFDAIVVTIPFYSEALDSDVNGGVTMSLVTSDLTVPPAVLRSTEHIPESKQLKGIGDYNHRRLLLFRHFLTA